jgi:hypothetical protein
LNEQIEHGHATCQIFIDCQVINNKEQCLIFNFAIKSAPVEIEQAYKQQVEHVVN